MWIGFDFGTTNSAAAIYAGGNTLNILPLNLQVPNSRTIRTVMYIEHDHKIYIGEEAIHIYYEQNTRRIPKLTKKYLGTIEITDSGGTRIEPVYAEVDENMPGQLIHSLKSGLTTVREEFKLFGRVYTLEELITEYLSILHFRVAKYMECKIEGVVLGRPVNFAGAEHEDDNNYAQMQLEKAARAAGFQNIEFELEPIAAGLGLQAKRNLYEAKHVLIFDFGGGTIDVAVIYIGKGQQEVLSIGGVGIAGDRFDQLIVQRKALNWFGQDVQYGPKNLPIPHNLMNELLEWQDIPHLYNSETIEFLHNAQRDCTNPLKLFALEELISKNCGYSLFEAVEASKVVLSKKRLSIIDFKQDLISIWQPLTRLEFEDIIETEKNRIKKVVIDTILDANKDTKDIDLVVRTGGSSNIPCFIDMLIEIFGREKVIEQDIFTGVVSGLAIRAYSLTR